MHATTIVHKLKLLPHILVERFYKVLLDRIPKPSGHNTPYHHPAFT